MKLVAGRNVHPSRGAHSLNFPLTSSAGHRALKGRALKGQEGVKKSTNVHTQFLLRIGESYKVQA
jgi:hypothetical protein